MYRFLLIGLAAFLAGCGSSGRQWEEAQPRTGERFATVSYDFQRSTVPVEPDVIAKMRQQLDGQLYGEGGFRRGQPGQGLDIQIGFSQVDEGSRFLRYMFAGIGDAGQGSMTVTASYRNPNGQELAKTRTEGKIGAGFFGGSFDAAIEEVTTRISDYARFNFLGTPTQTYSGAHSFGSSPTPTPPRSAGGNAQVLLGTFWSEAEAMAAVNRVKAGNADLMASASAATRPYQTDGGQTYYGAFARGLSHANAQALCGRVRASGQTCQVR